MDYFVQNGSSTGQFSGMLDSIVFLVASVLAASSLRPDQRQARNNNGSKFTVLSVATQRSWRNADDEWTSKTEWHQIVPATNSTCPH